MTEDELRAIVFQHTIQHLTKLDALFPQYLVSKQINETILCEFTCVMCDCDIPKPHLGEAYHGPIDSALVQYPEFYKVKGG